MLGILRVSLMLFATGACCAANAQQAESPLGGGPIVFSGMRLASVSVAGRADDSRADVESVSESSVDAVALAGVPLSRRGIRSGRGAAGNGRGPGERGETSRTAGVAAGGVGSTGAVTGSGLIGGKSAVTGSGLVGAKAAPPAASVPAPALRRQAAMVARSADTAARDRKAEEVGDRR